jgi:hypothetical protein
MDNLEKTGRNAPRNLLSDIEKLALWDAMRAMPRERLETGDLAEIAAEMNVAIAGVLAAEAKNRRGRNNEIRVITEAVALGAIKALGFERVKLEKPEVDAGELVALRTRVDVLEAHVAELGAYIITLGTELGSTPPAGLIPSEQPQLQLQN